MAEHLPINPRTGEPLPPRPQPGYYPDFSTLDQQAFWDAATREVVLKRVTDIPPIRFFAHDPALATALFDRILPQDDRDPDHRIPILNYVDERLSEGVSDGYRYAEAPSDAECYHLGLRGVESIAQSLHGTSFIQLGSREQDEIILSLRDNSPPAGEEIWSRFPAVNFFELLVTDAVDAYYAHPYAWDEIGFGGPSYPRGYMRLENGLAEPWEADEQRYDWEPPPTSLSGSYQPLAGLIPEHARRRQGGTH
ncbi:MAG TPA: gluconate 2-dehydrogenase subunit 3 family protein [Chloroflexota bacterium]|nr:gluconate 2-dehydrogenase subunit 3 family protein [Chloroflexota bacterium]